jgi:hypothetical protein
MLEDFVKGISISQIAIFAIGITVFLYYASQIQENIRIKKLGSRAPVRTAWLPFGLDVIYGSVSSVLKNETLEFFEDGMRRFANPNHPHTVELRAGKS